MVDPVLHLCGLHKSFGALTATNNLSLTVMPGEIHALIGPNGAGKTTLIQQIYGALKPDSGQIFLNGRDLTGLSVPERIRAGIGRSFQISNVLMDFTVLENGIIAEQARLGQSFRFLRPAFSDPHLIKGASAILDRVGLLDRAHQPVGDLAHGDRRMLELALALAASPSLLLPNREIRPAVKGNCPIIVRMVVVLPMPFRPISETTWPAGTDSETPNNTCPAP